MIYVSWILVMVGTYLFGSHPDSGSLMVGIGTLGVVLYWTGRVWDSENRKKGLGKYKKDVWNPEPEPYLTQQVATDVAESVDLNLDAVAALMAMKIKKIDAAKAVREAQETLGAEATTAQIVTEALRPK